MDELSRDLMTLAVQQALWEMGPVEFDMVKSKLKKDYQKTFEESLETPIFLKMVLCELFGNAYEDILASIDNSFKNVNMDDDLTNFITVMKK